MALDPLSAQILDTLSPHVEGRDHQFHFETNGALVYEKNDNDWEPPRPIDGYETDPENQWRLKPLWGRCEARMQTAVRFTSCGCIGLITRCTEPQAHFMGRVTYEICQQCPFQEKD